MTRYVEGGTSHGGHRGTQRFHVPEGRHCFPRSQVALGNEGASAAVALLLLTATDRNAVL